MANCTKPVTVTANAVAEDCKLYIGWTNAGVGSETGATGVQFLISGVAYSDGNSGYNVWPPSTNGIACEAARIAGGITANKVFKIIVRVVCSQDPAGKPLTWVDSDELTYTVPSNFLCATPAPTKPPHGKKNG